MPLLALLPLFALFDEEFDLILNFLKLSPCDEYDEPDDDDSVPGTNFKPTIISPRYVVTSSKGSLCVMEEKKRC